MVALKVVDPKSAYMDSKNLVPIWKREIEKIDLEINALDGDLETAIDNLNYIKDKKTKLKKQKEIALKKAMEDQGLFQ
ncbi:hypothetical protein [Leptospira bandrabouensis]|uniref:hypothetical protein n=1 Tax=Leptospira bandrabouensis TaxID=2484903 RepID=UPI001EE88E9A|nr:hypothetical protein [Leptospira bandrabouensis]MCG6144125.1 hypothetical protein [Leptospira bandrabouensis]MCG6159786.1 hypothetical protein [Leptospira bandrabouensis]MCG6163719.1 hypothetical protein [Leptospira bandrabouensis]